MSTARKVLLIAATALVVAGVALAGTAFALAGGDFRNLSTDQRHWEQCAYEISADQVALLSRISVSDSEDVRIEGYEGDTIRIEYWEHEQRGVLVERQGNELIVDGSDGGRSATFGVLFSYPEDHTTRVLVPKDFDGDLEAYGVDGGDASVARFEKLGAVTVDTESGMALANSFKAENLRLESDNGLVQGNLVTVNGTLSASASNGDVSLGSILADEVQARSENGFASLADTTANVQLGVATLNGDMGLLRVDAPSIETSSENGSIELTLPGTESDYALDAAAENGTVYGPTFFKSNAGRNVTARTQNGDVTVDFEGGDLSEESVVYRGEALEEVLGIQQEHGWVQPEGIDAAEADSTGENGVGNDDAANGAAEPAAAASPAAPAGSAAPGAPTGPDSPSAPTTPANDPASAATPEQEPGATPDGFDRSIGAFMRLFDWVV